MLFQHDPGQPIGSWTEIREDARGLFVRGRLATEVTRAREVLLLLRGGALDGLSIGFKTVRAKKDMADGVRRVLEADLWEISVVTFPMQPGARIHAVKSAGLPTVRQFERWLTRDAGLTRGEAQAVIGRGFAALRRERDAAPGNDPDTQLARRIRGATDMLISRKTTMRDMTETGHAPEMKSASGEISEAFGDFMQAFEAFKDANDQRLSEIESRFGGDVITTEKVDRISQALDAQKRTLDQLSLKQMRPVLGRGGGALPSEHKTAFDAYVRRGDDRQLRALDAKAMSYGSGQDGGYLVPAETEAEIGKRLSVISPIRAIASVKQISAAVLKKPFAATGPAAGWVFEARRGTLHAFRFRDPFEMKSCPPSAAPKALDQPLGVGDGSKLRFGLAKTYGGDADAYRRPIRLPVLPSLKLAVGGTTVPVADFSFDVATGEVVFKAPPRAGAAVTAGFEFDVPVRFDVEHLAISLVAFRAGQIPAIPLVEVLL